MSTQFNLVEYLTGRRTDVVQASHMPRQMTGAWADTLADVPLFASLSKRHRSKVAATAFTKRYPKGATLIRGDGGGEEFFLILDGRAVIRSGSRRITVGAGDFFGEMALLDGGPRSATVTAADETLVMIVPRSRFMKLLEREPKIAIAMLAELTRRLRVLQAAAGA
jgi:CRP/FNR family transcriptional regulator, cyclic AMP receptor protein